jgi:peptidoglycan/xylan/chitin deacetylase (PgdA/CDA1 family)
MTSNRFLALAYHDTVRDGPSELSGFQNPDALTYKVSLTRFREHLDALGSCKGTTPFEVLLTFDDGGCSALLAADLMEQVGRRGFFFVPTAMIDTPLFLTPAQIVELHRRGHIIGSHGVTHHGRMSRMKPDVLAREWSESVRTLSDITGSPILTASVPSGFYAHRVAEAAAAVGIRQIFTQQPTTRPAHAHGCEVLGRFTMRSWTSAEHVLALAQGTIRTRFQEALWWRVRKMGKALPGNTYRDLRRIYFDRRSSARSL